MEFYHEGERIRKYTGINKGSTAASRRLNAKRLISKLKKLYPPPPLHIDEKAKLYEMLENERPYLRLKSFQTYKSKLDHLFEWMGDDELTTENLRRYLNTYRKNHTQTGTYNARRMLMTFFKKAGLAHLLEPIKIKKGQHQPLRYFQPHQCEQLLDCMSRHQPMLWLHCLFIYYTALRPRSELINLRVDDIFFSERKIAVRGEFAKNHKTEFVHIAPNFFPLIEKLRFQPTGTYIFSSQRNGRKPAGRNTYGEKFRKVLDQFGYGRQYQLYSWKHTGAIAVYKATKNIMALRDHCRHKDVATTQLYLRQLGLDDYDDFYENFPSPTEWR